MQEKWLFILLGNLGGLNFGRLIFKKEISLKGKVSEGKTERGTRNTWPRPGQRFRVPRDVVRAAPEKGYQL